MVRYITTKYNKEPIDHGFDKWYSKTYGSTKYSKNRPKTRYYELKRAWKASKEFYKNA